MSQPLYTVVASSEAWPNSGSQAERSLNRGFLNDTFVTSTGGETANISPSTASQFTSTGDQTLQYVLGRRMRIVHGGASTDTTYCEVSAASFAAGVTTVTVARITSGATNLSTSAIAEVGLGPLWSSTAGSGNFPAVVSLSSGAAAAPSLSFYSSTGTGFFQSAANAVGVSISGSNRYDFATSFAIAATTPSIDLQPSAGNRVQILGNSTGVRLNDIGASGWLQGGQNAGGTVLWQIGLANGQALFSGAVSAYSTLAGSTSAAFVTANNYPYGAKDSVGVDRGLMRVSTGDQTQLWDTRGAAFTQARTQVADGTGHVAANAAIWGTT